MGKIAVLCSGQGMQTADMFEPLKHYPECCDFLKRAMDNSWLSDVAITALKADTLPDDILFDNIYAQELICLYQLTVWEKLKNVLPGDKVFAGYSLGEPVAYGVAEILSPHETFNMVRKRAAIMSSCVKVACAMLAVKGLTMEQMQEQCGKHSCSIAIYNPGKHFICAGLAKDIRSLETGCIEAHAEKVVPLKINVPSHTSLLSEATEEFRQYLQTCNFKMNPSNVILEGVSGRRIFNQRQAVETLSRQLSCPVMWGKNISAMIEYHCALFLELGPGHALAHMAGAEIHFGEARSVEEFSDLNELSGWLQSLMKRTS